MGVDSKILIDNRVGSKEFYDIFKALHKESEIELCRLNFGDFAFLGNGPDGPITIGIERKAIDDYLDSQHSGRLSGHQVDGLHAAYKVVYLIIEGKWRCNPHINRVELKRHGKWCQRDFTKRIIVPAEIVGYMNTLRIIERLHIIYTGSEWETAAYILALRHWWQGKEYTEHRAHLQLYVPKKAPRNATQLYKFALTLPRVSVDRARTICKHFRTIAELVAASESALVIPRTACTAGITEAAAAEIWKAIHT